MKRTHQIALGIVAGSGLALSVAVAYAHPGMGEGMGPMGHGPMGQGPMGHGPMQGAMADHFAGQQLMTPEERTAFIEKMRAAKTPEERQKLAEANHAEMQKRAKEKGITLPEHRGPMGFGPATK